MDFENSVQMGIYFKSYTLLLSKTPLLLVSLSFVVAFVIVVVVVVVVAVVVVVLFVNDAFIKGVLVVVVVIKSIKKAKTRKTQTATAPSAS